MTHYRVDHKRGATDMRLVVSTEHSLKTMTAFLDAHGIDVNDVPAPSFVTVDDGKVTFEVCERDADGHLVVMGDDVKRKFVTVDQRAPWPPAEVTESPA
ncbi:hypothetical protein [Amycolatopsis sp. NPDC001319]|uniref:hypothetical protein n=1 Tax=unclassified Amycolatopsis TaxID=2618356 RepID=UPI0036A7E342